MKNERRTVLQSGWKWLKADSCEEEKHLLIFILLLWLTFPSGEPAGSPPVCHRSLVPKSPTLVFPHSWLGRCRTSPMALSRVSLSRYIWVWVWVCVSVCVCVCVCVRVCVCMCVVVYVCVCWDCVSVWAFFCHIACESVVSVLTYVCISFSAPACVSLCKCKNVCVCAGGCCEESLIQNQSPSKSTIKIFIKINILNLLLLLLMFLLLHLLNLDYRSIHHNTFIHQNDKWDI